MSEVLREPKTSPKHLWLKMTNICDKGKFLVALEIDGSDKQVLCQCVDQDEGVVSHHHNLTQYLVENHYVDALKAELESIRKERSLKNEIFFNGKRFIQIPGFPKYFASACGEIYALRKNDLMKQTTSSKGYRTVGLYPDSKSKAVRTMVARAVLYAWIGIPPEGMHAAHLDGIKSNNHLENLKWVTAEENESHKALHGTKAHGSRQGSSKLTEADVIAIRNDFVRINPRRSNIEALAKKYKVSGALIRGIISRKAWKHI